MRYLIRSATALLLYIVVALLLHSFAYKSSLSVAEYRGLIGSLPARLTEQTGAYEVEQVQHTLRDLSIGADVGLSFDSKPLQYYLGEDKFDIESTIELLREGQIGPAKLKLQLLLAKVDRAYIKQLRVSKYLAYLGLVFLGFFVLVVLFMLRKTKLNWQQEILASDITYSSFSAELNAYLIAAADEEVTFTGNRAEVSCVGLDSVPSKLEAIVKKLAENFIRNSIEHGGARPEIRLLAGKSDYISINISFQEEGDYFVLTAKDDGEGLKIDSIFDEAVRLGVVNIDVAEGMSNLKRSKLIFFQGVSTRDKTNSMAQTDLTLDELRALVKPYAGVFSIQNHVQSSFQISVKIPKSIIV